MQSFTTMIMADGSEVSMTLNYAALYKLRAIEQFAEVYSRYMNIQMNGTSDELDVAFVLYVGYLCANVDDIDECMSEFEFYETMQDNRALLSKVYAQLVFPKEVQASAKRS